MTPSLAAVAGRQNHALFLSAHNHWVNCHLQDTPPDWLGCIYTGRDLWPASSTWRVQA